MKCEHESLWEIVLKDWKWILFGAIFSFVLASILVSGWPTGLIPQLTFPFVYAGDAYFQSWFVQRVMEGWFFDNAREGFPFGSVFLDYPASDTGNLLILKLIAFLTGNFYSALNLYFLISFAVTFVVSFIVFRAFAITPALSFVAAILFDFAPFHFQRFFMGHIFYTWYFMVPIFYYAALKIFNFSDTSINLTVKKILLYAFVFMLLGSFGVYYAVFGIIVLAVAGMASCRWLSMKLASYAIFFVVLGVGLNIAPNIVHQYEHGENKSVAHRQHDEADVYALKFVSLMIPSAEHHNTIMRKIHDKYYASFPPGSPLTAGAISPLGIVGSIGFIGLFLVIFFALSGKRQDKNMQLIALITLVLFMFGTIGGLGSVFSWFVSPSIRAWGRISIFINFGALFGLFLFMHSQSRQNLSCFLAFVLFCGGMYDQTYFVSNAMREDAKSRFILDKNFIASIEKILPPESAIYQLPYVVFPESGPLYNLDSYEPMVAFLHSKDLRWSYGGMYGREGDVFYRSLAEESIKHQLEEIRRLGFAGVYIDRRGYEDGGKLVIEGWSKVLNAKPDLIRSDGQVVFFKIPARAVGE